jgi:2-haloacid dehalogenase
MTGRWATFDCYGTLIDWDSGIRRALARVWPDHDAEQLFHRYHDGEHRVQAGRDIPYRQVLRETLAAIAEAEELEVPPGDEDALAESLPSWRPFPEVTGSLAELRERGWRLAILSNSDPDLLDSSMKTIGVEVDVRITAAEARAYKPAFAHWDTFFRTTMADRERHVHVAASLYHDVEPCARLGLPCVWVNRLRESSDLPRAGELFNLVGLPAALEALVPQ